MKLNINIIYITALHLAVTIKNIEIIKILLAQKGIDVDAKDEILFNF